MKIQSRHSRYCPFKCVSMALNKPNIKRRPSLSLASIIEFYSIISQITLLFHTLQPINSWLFIKVFVQQKLYQIILIFWELFWTTHNNWLIDQIDNRNMLGGHKIDCFFQWKFWCIRLLDQHNLAFSEFNITIVLLSCLQSGK